ncbi:MAG: PEP-CTERM sorting domain-containing protein [Planctomycetes bacterium]|nr:PEP-CTERM sorting domain-containing protein [Planctomycetota bacterium]
MRTLRLTGCLLLVVVATGMPSSAHADSFIFGGTDNTANYLEVTTTTGTVILSTDTNQILSGYNNQGWWSPDVGNSDDNANFIVGTIAIDSFVAHYHDYFTFDITRLAGQTVTGVTLNIQNPGFNTSTGTYSVYDVSTDPYTLNANGNGPNTAIYDDLGSGNLYGSQTIPLFNDSEYFIALNSFAVNDLQAAIDNGDTYFSTGGAFVGVPEPSTLVMSSLFAGAFGIAALRRNWSKSRKISA